MESGIGLSHTWHTRCNYTAENTHRRSGGSPDKTCASGKCTRPLVALFISPTRHNRGGGQVKDHPTRDCGYRSPGWACDPRSKGTLGVQPRPAIICTTVGLKMFRAATLLCDIYSTPPPHRSLVSLNIELILLLCGICIIRCSPHGRRDCTSYCTKWILPLSLSSSSAIIGLPVMWDCGGVPLVWVVAVDW